MDHRRFSCHSRWVYYLHLAYFSLVVVGFVSMMSVWVWFMFWQWFRRGYLHYEFGWGVSTLRLEWSSRHHRGRGPQTARENPFHQGPNSDFEGDRPVHRKTARRRSHHRQLTYAAPFLISFSSFEEKPQKKVVCRPLFISSYISSGLNWCIWVMPRLTTSTRIV